MAHPDLPSDLPPGCTARPLTTADSRAVFELMAAQEQHDLGVVEIDEADIVGDWQRPSYDVTASSLGVLVDDRLVAYAELVGPDRYDAAVHPDHRGRGIGTALAGWIRDLARRRGAELVGMPVPVGSAGDRLLESLGYHVRWTSWVLDLPPDVVVPHRALPLGHVLREAVPDDHAAVHAVQEDAFLEWSDRAREGFDDWAARVVGRPGFAPWSLRVVTGPTGEVVAMAFVVLGEDGTAHLDRLATRADHRGRGLAQALLVDAFTAAREHGATRSALSTDSRTGALGLYERVGMIVTATWLHRAVRLPA